MGRTYGHKQSVGGEPPPRPQPAASFLLGAREGLAAALEYTNAPPTVLMLLAGRAWRASLRWSSPARTAGRRV